MLLLRGNTLFITGTIIGIVSSVFWSEMPGYQWAVLLFLIILVSFRITWSQPLQGALTGIIIVILNGQSYIVKTESLNFSGKDIIINGVVDSLLSKKKHTVEFKFVVNQINGQPQPIGWQPKIKLYWPEPPLAPTIKLNQRWKFSVTVKPPYGRVNEAGFDNERYFVANQLNGSGKIISGTLLSQSQSYRQHLYDKTVQLTEPLSLHPLLLALSFGQRDRLQAEHWTILQRSGLAHLMAISGLHIGLAFSLGWILGIALRALTAATFLTWLPLIIACSAALGYAWLAGFSIPTQRALMACLIAALLLWYRTSWPKWYLFIVVMFCCLLLNPFSTLSLSFWLTFAVVAVLLLVMTLGIYRKGRGDADLGWFSVLVEKIKKLVLLQLALSLFLIPLQVSHFGGVSLASPIINLIAVPWVSFVTVPLVFVALFVSLFSDNVATFIWNLAHHSLFPVWWLAELAGGAWLPLNFTYLRMVTSMGVMVLVLWLIPFKRVIILLTVLLTLALYPKDKYRGWRLDLLDVGHGLAVIIEKQGEAILYDTGSAWEDGSMAQSVVIPVLRHRGIEQLEGVIISHSDNDHAGGQQSIRDVMQPKWIKSSQYPQDREEQRKHQPCMDGESWQWQGLDFQVVWPPKQTARAYNPHSCVIKISDSFHSILLTGDITSLSEMLMLNNHPELRADLLLVPHHGSRSSSTHRLLTQIGAQIAVVSVAKYNPWSLPASTVKAKYLQYNMEWIETAKAGQITIRYNKEKRTIIKHREKLAANWYRKLFGAMGDKE